MEEFSRISSKILVVAIIRVNKVFIPHGQDRILDGDIVYFLTTKGNKNKVFEITGKELFVIKNIMILGGSRIAQKTAEKLGDQYNIKIVEADRDRCIKIAAKLQNALIIHGDGRNLDLLKEESVDKMDAFVAVTGSAETNIISCQLAKSFGVKRTVAEVENIDFMNMAEGIGIGSIINKKLLAASYIYKYTIGGSVEQVKCLTAGDAEVFEFQVTSESKITGSPLSELDFPENAIIGGYIRGDAAYIASGNTQIKVGDLVVVFALPESIVQLKRFF